MYCYLGACDLFQRNAGMKECSMKECSMKECSMKECYVGNAIRIVCLCHIFVPEISPRLGV